MFRIPEEVFYHQILPFLKLDETLALLSSSNSLFEELRYRSGKRNFKVSLRDLTKITFTKLLQKISPTEQLILSCKRSTWHDILTTMNGISPPLLPKRLHMGLYCGIVASADLSKIQELSLNDCLLQDVNCLAHLKWLSLGYCPGIHDVHSLRNIPKLSIRDCTGIRDISALQNNKKLSIYRCNNISMSTVNFVNILYLSTDLPLTYAATATLKNARSLELVYFSHCAVFLASTVVSVEIRNPVDIVIPQFLNMRSLNLDLSNFTQSLKSVLLEGISSRVNLTPLGSVEMVQLQLCYDLVNVKGLGKHNKTVIIDCCRNIRDFSALKTVPRVIVRRCSEFIHCEDLNQVHHLTITEVCRSVNFSGLKKEKGSGVHRLELLDCNKLVSFKGLDEIPFLKITSDGLQSLEGLGGKENKIIILEAKYEQSVDQFIPKDCYSKLFYTDVNAGKKCLMLQLMRK
jgi:hypothetical protein